MEQYSHVLVTGGSSGIGNCFMTTIRKRNAGVGICNLSRSELKEFGWGALDLDLRCDLSVEAERTAALGKVEAWLAGGRQGRLLVINNAGFGSYGPFAESDLSETLSMLEVNCRAVVAVTHRLLGKLEKRGGAILNIASTAAFQPTPWMATYGASKAFLLHWSLALREELKVQGIPVVALCPGPTESRFFERAGFTERPLAGHGQTAQAVVDYGLWAVERGKACPVSGWVNKMLVAASGLLSKRWQAVVAGKVLEQVRLKKR